MAGFGKGIGALLQMQRKNNIGYRSASAQVPSGLEALDMGAATAAALAGGAGASVYSEEAEAGILERLLAAAVKRRAEYAAQKASQFEGLQHTKGAKRLEGLIMKEDATIKSLERQIGTPYRSPSNEAAVQEVIESMNARSRLGLDERVPQASAPPVSPGSQWQAPQPQHIDLKKWERVLESNRRDGYRQFDPRQGTLNWD